LKSWDCGTSRVAGSFRQKYTPFRAGNRGRTASAFDATFAALDALDKEPLFRKATGEVFIDYYLKLERNEAGRYQRWVDEGRVVPADDGTTDWEQREYFDFF